MCSRVSAAERVPVAKLESRLIVHQTGGTPQRLSCTDESTTYPELGFDGSSLDTELSEWIGFGRTAFLPDLRADL